LYDVDGLGFNAMKQTITVLGATGSIGQSTLDIVRRHPERYHVFALSAGRSIERMLEDIGEFQPRYAVMADAAAATQLLEMLGNSSTEVLTGTEALAMVASHKDVDMVMAAIVGAAGLLPTIAAAEAGKRILLANKESLVMAGPLFMEAVRRGRATLLPIDSEHNAIFQSLPAHYDGDLRKNGIRKILLTASGGPFRGKTLSELAAVTPEQAVAHPNWSMGRKISVDSATLMNKGLELIEACFLFNCQPRDIQVVVHPQSIIHSMVQYCDGSIIAQLGQPDMRTPIAYGMAWPERIEAGVASLDLFEIARLDFCPPDHITFPCLALAGQAFAAGGSMPAVLNAANEIAVDAFLQEQIAFNQIPTLIRDVMGMHVVNEIESIDHVIEADHWARDCASQWISRSVS
jgi:1-deoxy-D-xylulose-5-phosphate reductoisomerase